MIKNKEEIRLDYLTTNKSLRELSEEHDIGSATLLRWSQKEGWNQLKQELNNRFISNIAMEIKKELIARIEDELIEDSLEDTAYAISEILDLTIPKLNREDQVNLLFAISRAFLSSKMLGSIIK